MALKSDKSSAKGHSNYKEVKKLTGKELALRNENHGKRKSASYMNFVMNDFKNVKEEVLEELRGVPQRTQHNGKKRIGNGEDVFYIGSIKKLKRNWKDKFIYKLQETGNIRLSCEYADVSRTFINDLRKSDEQFGLIVDLAKQDYCDRLEAEMDRRGLKGYVEPVYYKGEIVGGVRRYSDYLLLARAKAEMKDKYKEGTNININNQQNTQVVLGFSEKDDLYNID